jgi:hypothetical protein
MALSQKTAEHPVADIMEAVLLKGDLIKLTPEERLRYYNETCRSLGLNPLTRPFEYLMLNGKLQLYARRDATDQLRKLHGISVKILNQKVSNDLLTVHVQARDKEGREDEDVGAISFPDTLRGEIRSNAIMKAVTKAKRRVTLSICGLGLSDESEVDDIPGTTRQPPVPEIQDEVSETEDRITDELIRKAQIIQDRRAQAERENETDVVKQAGMRCADPRFWKFLAQNHSEAWKFMNTGTEGERAAELVRSICGVRSRKDLATETEAREHWHALEAKFQAWLRV